MDEFLAKLYGTDSITKEAAQETSEGLEKVAEDFASSLESLCKEAGIDPNQLSDQDIADAWNSFVFFRENPEAIKYASLTQEDWIKADSMGRILAHSFANEMTKLAGKADIALGAGIGLGTLAASIAPFIAATGGESKKRGRLAAAIGGGGTALATGTGAGLARRILGYLEKVEKTPVGKEALKGLKKGVIPTAIGAGLVGLPSSVGLPLLIQRRVNKVLASKGKK